MDRVGGSRNSMVASFPLGSTPPPIESLIFLRKKTRSSDKLPFFSVGNRSILLEVTVILEERVICHPPPKVDAIMPGRRGCLSRASSVRWEKARKSRARPWDGTFCFKPKVDCRSDALHDNRDPRGVDAQYELTIPSASTGSGTSTCTGTALGIGTTVPWVQ